jgi:hypothetical protein
MGVAAEPDGFETVTRIDRKEGGIVLRGKNRAEVAVPLDWAFLHGA